MANIENNKALKDERIQALYDDREEEKQRTNDAIISNMINALQKNTPALAIPTAITKMAAKHLNDSGAKNIPTKLSPEQLKQLNDSGNMPSTGGMLEASPYAKYLGEIAGVLGLVNQVAGSKAKAKEQDQHQDNLTKAIYHLQNGTKFRDLAPALGVGTSRSMMNAAGTISAGSWLHDMATTGQLSGLTTGSMTMSNPGMMAAGAFGGVAGMGHAVGGGLSGITNLLGGTLGTDKLNGLSGGLANLDPTTAAVLGVVSMIGTGIGAKKLMDSVMKNSPLAQKEKRNRWNLSHATVKASDNPAALQSYISSNNILKQMQNQNAMTSAETLIASKLNEIAYNTASIADIYEVIANTRTGSRNAGTRSLNKIDKETLDGLSTEGLGNLFKGGKLSKSAISFLKHNEGLKYLADVFSISTYYKSLKGEDTASGQFKLRDALNQGDPDSAKKQFAMKHGLTMTGVDLLHANIAQKIASADTTYEGRMLAAGIYSNLFLQMIATKLTSGGNSNLVGELAKLMREQEEKFQATQTMFVDGMLKPFMKGLSKIPGLSALVPALHAGAYVTSTAVKGISGAANFIANPIKGIKGFATGAMDLAKDIRGRVIDGMTPDSIKNEQDLRTRLNAKVQTTEQLAAHYTAYTLHDDLTDIKKLLGYTGKGKVIDKYTGERVTEDELRRRNFDKRKKLRDSLNELNPDESYFDEASTWMKKKIFNIKDRDVKKSNMKNYSHIGDLLNEFSDNTKAFNDPDAQFRMGGTTRSNTTKKSYKQTIYNIFGDANSGTSNASTGPVRGGKNSGQFNPPVNTQDLITRRAQEERMERFFELHFENLPYLKKLYNGFFGKKDIKSGMLSSATGNNPFDTLFGGGPDLDIDIDGDRDRDSKRKRRLNRLNKNKPGKLSGIGNGIKQYGSKAWEATKNFGTKMGNMNTIKAAGRFIGQRALLPIAGALSGVVGGVSLGTVGLITAAVAAVGTGVDQIFNDGKATKYIWDSFKNTEFGKTTIELFDSAKSYYLGFQDYITNAFSKAWSGITGIGDKVGKMVDDYKGTMGSETLPGAISNHLTRNRPAPIQKEYLTQQQINDLLSGVNEPAERLKILQSKKNNIKADDYKQIQNMILEEKARQRTEKFGWSMAPKDVLNHLKDFENMDAQRRAEYYGEYNKHQNELRMSKNLTASDEKEYKKINTMIGVKFAELQKDKRSQAEKDQESKLLKETLEKMTESSISSVTGIESLVKQSENVQKGIVKNFSDQINYMAQQQASITNMLTVTAKTIQKPAIFELDKTVISLIPELKGQ